MIPYMILLFLIALFLLLNKNLDSRKSYLLLIMIFLMSIFSSIRGIDVGTDNFMYENIYESFNVDSLSSLKDSRFYEITEKGFVYLSYTFNYLGLGYRSFLFFLNFLYLYIFWVISKKISINNEITWFIFVCFGYFTFIFNGLRQGVAVILCMLAFYFYKNKKILMPSLLIVFASSFHTSCLVFFIIPFIIYGTDRVRLFLISIWTFFVIFALPYLFILAEGISNRYSDYSEFKTENSGAGAVIFLFLNFIIFLYYFSKKEDEDFKIYLTIFYFGLVVAFSSFFNGYSASGLMRLSFYFTWTMLFLWPYIFRLYNLNSRPLVYIIFFVFCVVYFYLSTTKYGDLIPYYI